MVITDVFLKAELSEDLKTNLTFSCCFSAAESVEGYLQLFDEAGLIEPYFEDHTIELKKVAYKVYVGYGSLQAFWDQFARGNASCCSAAESSPESSDLWKRMFMEGKPGYCLLSFTKPGSGTHN